MKQLVMRRLGLAEIGFLPKEGRLTCKVVFLVEVE